MRMLASVLWREGNLTRWILIAALLVATSRLALAQDRLTLQVSGGYTELTDSIRLHSRTRVPGVGSDPVVASYGLTFDAEDASWEVALSGELANGLDVQLGYANLGALLRVG